MTRGVPEIPSPIFHAGRLYLVRDGGILSCVHTDTGKVIYRERLGAAGQYSASPVIANDHLYLVSGKGVITVVKTGDAFEITHQADLKDAVVATPAMDQHTLYIRTDASLLAFRLAASESSDPPNAISPFPTVVPPPFLPSLPKPTPRHLAWNPRSRQTQVPLYDLKQSWKPGSLPPSPGRRAPRIIRNRLPLRIGADHQGQNRFHGQMARVTLWNRALDPEEIFSRAGSDRPDAFGSPGPSPNPVRLEGRVAEWDWARIRGTGFHCYGSETLFAFKVGQIEQWAMTDGSARRLLHFRGQGYLEVPHQEELDLEDAMTLEAWIRPDPMPPQGGRIFDKSTGATANGFLLDTQPGRSLRWAVAHGTLGYYASLPTNRWSHVAGVFDAHSGKQELYLNGRLVATTDPLPATATRRPSHNSTVAIQ